MHIINFKNALAYRYNFIHIRRNYRVILSLKQKIQTIFYASKILMTSTCEIFEHRKWRI